MNIIKGSDFKKELSGGTHRGYLFFGEEDYLKSFALKQARESICPDPTFAFFNELRIDAMDYTPQKLQDALMPMPMMAEFKLVTLSGLNFTSMRQGELDALCEVLASQEEFDYNILIVTVAADCFDAGYLPKRPSATLTRLAEYLCPVHFERCTTAKLVSWVSKHFAHHGVDAPAELCALIPEYCGHSMFTLASEIEKLCFYTKAHNKTTASEEDMRLVCTPATEYDAFAFANAIMEGKPERALNILADYRFRRVEPIVILGEVIRVICEMIGVQAMTAEGAPAADIAAATKVPEFKVKLYQKSLRSTTEKKLRRALEACNEADAALKTGYTADYTALERLICSL